MKKSVRKFIQYVLALAILASTPVQSSAAGKGSRKKKLTPTKTEAPLAEVINEMPPETTVVSTASEQLTSENGAKADLSVSVVESENEEKVLQEIVESAQGPVVVFDNGENIEEVKEALEELNLKEGQEVSIIEISAPDTRNWKQKFADKMGQIKASAKEKIGYLKENKKALRTALVVNIAVTGIAGGATYIFTHDLVTSFGTASVLFAVSTVRTIFTEQWMAYLDKGGRAMFKLSDRVSSIVDRVFNGTSSRIHTLKNKVFKRAENPLPAEPYTIDFNKRVKAHEHALDVTGSIMAAAFAGAVTYAGVLLINGDLVVNSMAAALAVSLLGAASAYDYVLFDVTGRYLLKAGVIDLKTYKKLLQYASFVSPSIDSIYVAAPHFAPIKIVVIGLGVSGLVLAYKGAQVVRALDTAKKKAITSVNSYFSRNPVVPTPCDVLLGPRYDKAGFIPYDDVG